MRASSCHGYQRHSQTTRGARTTTFNDVTSQVPMTSSVTASLAGSETVSAAVVVGVACRLLRLADWSMMVTSLSSATSSIVRYMPRKSYTSTTGSYPATH